MLLIANVIEKRLRRFPGKLLMNLEVLLGIFLGAEEIVQPLHIGPTRTGRG